VFSFVGLTPRVSGGRVSRLASSNWSRPTAVRLCSLCAQNYEKSSRQI